MTGLDKRKAFTPWLIIFGLWAVLHGALAITVAAPVFEGQLPGPDEYMRLVRVAELRGGTGWYDTVIERSNAPYGDTLHWTRPMDLLILAGSYALSMIPSVGDALFASGALVSPALHLAICFAMAWAALPLIGRDLSIIAVFMVLIQPGVLAYAAAGRADHHGFLFLLFVLAAGGAIRCLGTRVTTATAVATGVAFGVALWEGVEMVVLVALCQAAAALAWIFFGGVKARPQLIAAGTFVATVLLALIAEHPPAQMLAIEYDRVSLPYLTIAALTALVWGAAWISERYKPAGGTPVRRATLMGIAGSIGALFLFAVFPKILAGPYAVIDPRILPIWDAHIAELGSLAPVDLEHAGQFLFFIGTVLPCVVYSAISAWRRRGDVPAAPWMLMTLLLAAYFVLALQHLRMAPFAEIASAPVLAEMTGRLVEWSERRLAGLFRLVVTCGTVFVLMFGSVLAGGYLLSLNAAAAPSAPGPDCRISRIAPLLNDPAGLGAAPHTIATLLDHGPEILYRTRHLVVSAPYHRNGAGIWDSYRLFSAPKDEESRAIAARRGIELLMICPSGAERQFFTRETGRDNLYTRLLDGAVPAWLAPVPMDPEQAGGFRLYRVVR